MEIRNLQDFILALTSYWTDLGCIWSQPYDMPMGAGTFHPHTFLKGVGPEPWRAVYVQPCRRPVDGRYGKSTYRWQHYYQLQVILKPSPANIVDLFMKSLEAVGIELAGHDIGLLEDDWKGPTLGAWGLGWEVRANGQEVTQFTYFQQLGGLDLDVVSGEITYGTERLFMYSKGIKNGLEMPFNDNFTYGDIFYQNEYEFSHFNFKEADTKELFQHFDKCEANVARLCEKNLVLPAYDYVLQASHTFNLLDARGAISVSERQRFIGRVRECARKCAVIYLQEREKLGFPMQKRLDADSRQILTKRDEKPQAIAVRDETFSEGKQRTFGNIVFELGVEEMPPSFQLAADKFLRSKVTEFLAAEKDAFVTDNSFAQSLKKMSFDVLVSSRRLALIFREVPSHEPDKTLEIWGPAEKIAKAVGGGLTAAGEGFCRKNNIDPSSVSFKKKGDTEFLFAERKLVGRNVPMHLGECFKNWVSDIPAALKMKWLPPEISPPFVRPVRWVLALADAEVIPLEMFGLKSGRRSAGQRILSPEFFEISDASQYLTSLKEKAVMVDHRERLSLLKGRSSELAASVGGRVVEDDSLLQKCVGLSESPDIFMGDFDKKYLNLPGRLVASVLREHMNYMSVQDQNGSLLPFYIGVANYKCKNPQEMIAGTQGVVVGRLDDGSFYYDTDLATPISEFRESLKAQMFQGGMGTLWDKTERVAKLSEDLVSLDNSTNEDSLLRSIVQSAGEYSKADLKTGCVQEFPDEMQGLMGEILVRSQKTFGENSAVVAKAIGEHYMPLGASAPLPSTLSGCVVALADKIDSLAMFINSGADVKGNKDPFGLRRAAIAVLRLLGMDGDSAPRLNLQLKEVVCAALENLKAFGWKVGSDTEEKISNFIHARLKAAWREEFDAGVVEAVNASAVAMPLQQVRKLVSVTTEALRQKGEGSFAAAIAPYKRCRNLTQSLPQGASFEVEVAFFRSGEERELFETLQVIERTSDEQLKKGNFQEYLGTLAKVGGPLSKFFDAVMVNDSDAQLKTNRQALLLRIRALYEKVADFSQVQVD